MKPHPRLTKMLTFFGLVLGQAEKKKTTKVRCGSETQLCPRPPALAQLPNSLGILALQQAAVGGNLLLQPGLHIQQDLVLLVLLLHLAAQLGQLLLHAANQPLDLGQLHAVAVLCLGQATLQGCFLQGSRRGRISEGAQGPLQSPGHLPTRLGSAFTMLSWDCSSISRACKVRRSSEISLLQLCTSLLLVATSQFSSSVCRQDTGQGSVSLASLLQGNPHGFHMLSPEPTLDPDRHLEHPIPPTPLTMATFLTCLGLSGLLPNLAAGAMTSHQPATSPNPEDFERMLSFISNAFKKKVQGRKFENQPGQ